MSKIIEENGHQYSRYEFAGYKYRAKARFTTLDDVHYIDIYTTDPHKQNVESVLCEHRGESVVTINIIHWTTKEQDDRSAEFLKDFGNIK